MISTIVDGTPGFLWRAARRRSMARAIDELARRRAGLPVTEIVAEPRRHADRPISPPLLGPVDPLADVLVHSGDIRNPRGLPFQPDPQPAGWALDFLAGRWPLAFVPVRRLRGISLHANDIGRTWRRGAEVCGPAAALMMAVTGRTALLHRLDGPGLPMLRERLSLT